MPTVKAQGGKTQKVASVALRNRRGEILLATRPPGKTMAGVWEFPGGKLENGETMSAALRRELAEELGLELDAAELVATAAQTVNRQKLEVSLFLSRRWRGEPRPLEGQRLKWVKPTDLPFHRMPPANRFLLPPLLKMLELL